MARRHYLDDENLVITVFAGAVGDDEVLAHVESLIADGRVRPGFREFADCRRVTLEGDLTSNGLRRVAEFEVTSPLPAGGRLAFVAPPGVVYGMGRMFSVFAEDTREEIRVFTEPADACAWLGTDLGPVLELLRE